MKKKLHIFLITVLACTVSCETEIPHNEDVMPIPPCDYNILEGLQANSTISINCLLDLEDAVIELPANVNLSFGGGDIINGKLIFSGGTIDGRILNSKLEVEGTVSLLDSVFIFNPKRWESIVEGPTTSDIALQNNEEFERLMFFTRKLGASVFEIDKFDAFFEISKVTGNVENKPFYPHEEAINIPSNFHLKMSENTNLRVFPGELGGNSAGAILCSSKTSFSKVTGGNLHGDRDEREYSAENVEEGSHLYYIYSGDNITLDGINFINGSVGGLNIKSNSFTYETDYKPTKNILVKNCVFTNIRRTALVITDGREIEIIGNKFINSGQPSINSDGGTVGYSINIEPTRYRDDEGNLVELQKVTDVLIQNNTEEGSRGGFVTVTVGQNVTIDNNNIESKVVYTFASGTRITGNQFIGSEVSGKWVAIIAGGKGETVFDNIISGNTIIGYETAISASTADVKVSENDISECGLGIQIAETFDSQFTKNKIIVSDKGIGSTNTFNNNVLVTNNEISAGRFQMYFVQLNNEPDYLDFRMTIEGNKFLTHPNFVVINDANGINFNNNDVTGGISVGTSKNIEVSNNTFNPAASYGIKLYGTHSIVSVYNNTINLPPSATFECIINDSETPAEVDLHDNTCL